MLTRVDVDTGRIDHRGVIPVADIAGEVADQTGQVLSIEALFDAEQVTLLLAQFRLQQQVGLDDAPR